MNKPEGKPALKGVHADAEAALETVLNLPWVNEESLFVLGQSLGGAITVYMPANFQKQEICEGSC